MLRTSENASSIKSEMIGTLSYFLRGFHRKNKLVFVVKLTLLQDFSRGYKNALYIVYRSFQQEVTFLNYFELNVNQLQMESSVTFMQIHHLNVL